MKDPLIIKLDDFLEIDLNNLPKRDWERIQTDAKFLIANKYTSNVSKAYIAAFWIYIQDLSILAAPISDSEKYN